MGWQSPPPGHQSAVSLRKHLRELGRQLKGADWHYRKVTPSTVCLTQRCCVPADSLRRRWLPAQAHAPFGSIPRPGRLAQTAGREPGQHYMVLQLFFPPHFPTCTRRKTHPCRVIHSRTAWQKVPTSTWYLIQKGPREEALPTKITLLASNYTPRINPQAFEHGQKKASITTLLTHSSPPTSYSKSHQKRSLPFIRGMQANTFPQHKPILSDLRRLPTYLQFPLASRCSGCHCCQLPRSVPQRLPWEAGQ